ncbi:hypothetical protein GFS24_27170 [Chitinophaga sp. SYP-B3965]|uniref:hypothetical protein n=1 Tax=Chitinophaga sp. SYP-B3965 TaxID=2663120 RepID=UPI0012995D93|nr:hypothetical protein [Chitinophaga sp. SYP-B3965]MRG48821.1 hypothetical protein [Chitinophaga sp. SYP-B3965]
MSNTMILFDKLLRVQERCLDVIEYDQAKTVLRALKRSRVKQLLVLIFSNIVTVHFALAHLSNLVLVVLAGLLVLLNAICMAGVIWQLNILQQQEYWEQLHGPQKRTGLLQTAALLQSVIIRFTRIRFLTWPLCSVYVMIGGSFIGWNTDMPGLQLGMAGLLLPVSLWLYYKVRYTNLHIKWVEGFVNRAGRKYLLELMGFSPADGLQEKNQ